MSGTLPAVARFGFTRLVSRVDGIAVKCQACGRDTHLGTTITTLRETTGRTVSLSVCYDCVEVCALAALGRMPCEKCGEIGHTNWAESGG